jgi:hypothetical protein
MKRNASSKQLIGETIDLLLSYQTNNKDFQNIVITLAMIHANTEGH